MNNTHLHSAVVQISVNLHMSAQKNGRRISNNLENGDSSQ